MAENEEKRMAGDYEVFHALNIGNRELVLGEDPDAAPDERYMCGYCESNGLFSNYADVAVSDDYVEILEVFQKRLNDEVNALLLDRDLLIIEGIDDRPVTREGFTPVSYDDDLNGKVIVIKPEVLRREYRKATHQYQLCTGGFGASPHSRGSACFCTNLYSGKTSRYERMDVLGIVNEDQMPEWAKEGLTRIQKQKAKQDREAR